MIIKKFSYLRTEHNSLPTSQEAALEHEYDSVLGWLSGAYIGDSIAAYKSHIQSILQDAADHNEDIILYYEASNPEGDCPVNDGDSNGNNFDAFQTRAIKVINSARMKQSLDNANIGEGIESGFDAAAYIINHSDTINSNNNNKLSAKFVTMSPQKVDADAVHANIVNAKGIEKTIDNIKTFLHKNDGKTGKLWRQDINNYTHLSDFRFKQIEGESGHYAAYKLNNATNEITDNNPFSSNGKLNAVNINSYWLN